MSASGIPAESVTDLCEEDGHDWTEWTREGFCDRCGLMVTEAIDWDPETGGPLW